MSAYFLWCYSAKDKDEEVAIDEKVDRNRKAIVSGSRKAISKILIIFILRVNTINKSPVPCAHSAVILPTPTSIIRLQHIDKSRIQARSAVILPTPTSIIRLQHIDKSRIKARSAIILPIRLQHIDKSRIKTTENYLRPVHYLRPVPVIRPRVDKIRLVDKIGKINKRNDSMTINMVNMEETILQLRGGGVGSSTITLLRLCAYIGYTIVMHLYEDRFGAEAAFLTPTPPLLDKGRSAWFSGPKFQRIGRDTLQVINLIKTVSIDETGFVMDYNAAFNLIKERYSGTMPLPFTENLHISAWQAVKHLYHGRSFGIDPEIFGLSQKELNLLHQELGGLISYVRRNHTLPCQEHVKAFQNKVIDICNNSSTARRDDSIYYGNTGPTPATIYYNTETRHIFAFNNTSGDFITGGKRNEKDFRTFLKENTLGKKNYINKSSESSESSK